MNKVLIITIKNYYWHIFSILFFSIMIIIDIIVKLLAPAFTNIVHDLVNLETKLAKQLH